MEVIDKIVSFVNGSEFFWYHGYGLTFLWIVACTVAILAKKINLYLHALLFFVTDVLTIFLVGGAFYRYLPKFGQWN
jgi:glucose dehydrogenase